MTDSDTRPEQAHMDTRYVLFDAGQQRWWVQADQVREIHAALTVWSVPQTAAWFLGTALPRGRLVAVSDFGAWLAAAGPDKAGSVTGGTVNASPVKKFIEFEQGVALGVESVQASAERGSATQFDLQTLLESQAFCCVSSSSGRTLKNNLLLATAHDGEHA